MALVKCKECGREIAETAKVCINCGAKTEIAKIKSKRVKKVSIIVLIIILIVMSIILGKIVIQNSNNLVKSKNRAIGLLEKYKDDEIDTPKLVDELEQLSDDIEKLSNEEKNTTNSILLGILSRELYRISIEVNREYLGFNTHRGTSDAKINQYIQNIRDI